MSLHKFESLITKEVKELSASSTWWMVDYHGRIIPCLKTSVTPCTHTEAYVLRFTFKYMYNGRVVESEHNCTVYNWSSIEDQVRIKATRQAALELATQLKLLGVLGDRL